MFYLNANTHTHTHAQINKKRNLQLLDNPLYTDVFHRNTNRLSGFHHVPEAQLANYLTPSSETKFTTNKLYDSKF